MGKFNYTEKENHILFWNGHFSNWYPAPFVLDGMKFNCAEQYMMYMKAKTFGDQSSMTLIMNAANPAHQKRLGKAVANFNPVKWDEVKEDIVYDACLAKYSQDKDLGDELVKTGGKILVEASPYDTIWGIGMGELDPDATDETKWKGQNLLGKALMRVRDYLMK